LPPNDLVYKSYLQEFFPEQNITCQVKVSQHLKKTARLVFTLIGEASGLLIRSNFLASLGEAFSEYGTSGWKFEFSLKHFIKC
jgi:hypothetical protein